MRVLLQNMTEGPATEPMRRSQVVLASEVDRGRFRSGFPDRFRTYCPIKAPHLGIAWDPWVVKNAKPGALRFHDSGEAEGWPFRTPPRGLAWIKAEVAGDPWVFWTTWLLNSWMPHRPDRHTRKRRFVVETLELPQVRRKVQEWDERGFRQAGGGDMNSLRWEGRMGPLVQVKSQGLDRAYVSPNAWEGRRAVRDLTATETPETGVGGDMRHKGILLAWPT